MDLNSVLCPASLIVGLNNYLYTVITILTSPFTIPDISQLFLTIGAVFLTIQFINDPTTQYKNNPEILLEQIEVDFIVVGSGSGGSVTAARLSEANDFITLLLEAGCRGAMLTSEPPLTFISFVLSPQDYQYVSVDDNLCKGFIDGCNLSRGKMLGGCPEMNLMFAIRGNESGYDDYQDKYGCKKWNSSYTTPYFKKSEGNTNPNLDPKYHSTTGPLKISEFYPDKNYAFILKGVNEAGFPTIPDINVPHGPGICKVQGTIYNGRRCSVLKAYINPIQCRKNLKILKCAIVTQVLFENGKAVGVTFYYNGQQYKAMARKAVILTAGSIDTPLILQQSGIGLQEDLVSSGLLKPGQKPFLSLPTGRHLHDHVSLWMWMKLTGKIEQYIELLTSIGGYNAPEKTGQFAGAITFPCVGFFSIPMSNGVPIIAVYFIFFEVLSTKLSPVLIRFKFKPEIVKLLSELNKKYAVLATISVVLTPKSEGNVRVRDPGPTFIDNPYIKFNYLSDQEGYDRKALIQAMELVQSFTKTPTWSAANTEFVRLPIPCDNITDVNSFEYRDCYMDYLTFSNWHPTGTARMGNDTDTSVCTARCNVHGIPNLFAVDASIFPRVPAGNTNWPTVMAAEKCSDYIKDAFNISFTPPEPLTKDNF